MHCDISVERIAQLTLSGDLHWCSDYFGFFKLFGNGLLGETDPNKTVSVDSIEQAYYEENQTPFWLIYYRTAEVTQAFLQVLRIDSDNSVWKELQYTGYDGAEITCLNDAMNLESGDGAKVSPTELAMQKTFDHYIAIWRNLLFTCSDIDEHFKPWEFAKDSHVVRGESNLLMDAYMRQHRCPVCGCYYTSVETTCIHCSFPDLNVQFVNKEEYLLWEKEKLVPFREFYKLQNP